MRVNFQKTLSLNWEKYIIIIIIIIIIIASPSRRTIYGRSPAEIVGSNPSGGMDVCLLRVLCVVR